MSLHREDVLFIVREGRGEREEGQEKGERRARERPLNLLESLKF